MEQVRATHKQATDLIDLIVAEMNSVEADQGRLLDEKIIAEKPMAEKNHVLEVVGQLLYELERLEPLIAKTEDELGLPRSSENDRWDGTPNGKKVRGQASRVAIVAVRLSG